MLLEGSGKKRKVLTLRPVVAGAAEPNVVPLLTWLIYK